MDTNEAKPLVVFLCGDVMTGRGIDQVLPHPGNPTLCESYVVDARDYVALAEGVSGPIPRPVSFDYIWGDVLEELDQAGVDGDALDILVLAGQPSFPGCWIEVRPVGLLDMLDQGVPDAKVLAVIAHNPQHQRIRDHADVEPHVLREIEYFFSVYKELEGKRTEILGWRNADEAHTLIGETHQNFRAQAR
jgi:inorganic pyrophosphatase